MSSINLDSIRDKLREKCDSAVQDIAKNIKDALLWEGKVEKEDLSQVIIDVIKDDDNHWTIRFITTALSEEANKFFRDIFYPNAMIRRKWA